MTPDLIRSFRAGAAIGAARIVAFGSADNEVIAASGNTAAMIGICIQPGGAASGAACDVVLAGIAEAEAGGTITRGALVTADSSGRAVAASAAAGTNIRVVGVAMASAATGDIIPILVSPGSFQG